MRDMVSVGGLFLIIINAEYLDHMCRLDHSFVTNLVMTIDVKGSMEYYTMSLMPPRERMRDGPVAAAIVFRV